MATYADWDVEVQRMDAVPACGLPEEVVDRLRWVENGANREREHCAALLSDLNKPPIPRNVKKLFYMPLARLSVLVRRLRGALLWVLLNEFCTDIESRDAWMCGLVSLKGVVRLWRIGHPKLMLGGYFDFSIF